MKHKNSDKDKVYNQKLVTNKSWSRLDISARKVRTCSKIPEETCREVAVPQCRLVPTKRAVFRTVRECQHCEAHSQLVVTTHYQKTCQRQQKQKCETEYQEVGLLW